MRAFERLLRPPLFSLGVGLAALLALLVIVAHLATLPDVRTAAEPRTGDFLAFFVGGELVARGQGAALYDEEAQAAVQAELQGGPRPYRQVYLNPPGFAAALALGTSAGYRGAYLVFCLVMAGALVAAVALLRTLLPRLLPTRTEAALLLVALFALPGVARLVGGGQNTLLTLALLCATVGGIGRPAWISGVAVGLLSYKPQHAAIGVLVLATIGAWRSVGLAAGVGAIHYLLGALLCGADWPARFWTLARAYGAREAAEGQLSHVSLPRALGAQLGGVGTTVGWLLAAGALGWSLQLLSRRGPTRAAVASVLAAGLLASPHLQFYDGALALLPALLIAEEQVGEAGLPLESRLGLVGLALAWELNSLAARAGAPIFPLALALVWLAATRAASQARPTPRLDHA
jgi:hypothetical protein